MNVGSVKFSWEEYFNTNAKLEALTQIFIQGRKSHSRQQFKYCYGVHIDFTSSEAIFMAQHVMYCKYLMNIFKTIEFHLRHFH